jgi:nucleotide-binding universal stress UspA family protein
LADQGGNFRKTAPPILVAFDFSEPSWTALEFALNRARSDHREVLLVCVLEPFYGESFLDGSLRKNLSSDASRNTRRNLDKLIAAKPESPSIRYEIRFGLPEHEILKVAETVKPEMIVIGRTARTFLNRTLFGSVSRNVLDVSPFPVVVINSNNKEKRLIRGEEKTDAVFAA